MTLDDVMKILMQLPKDAAHKELYEYVLGKKLNLDAPQDLNEKLQWLMVNRYGENVSLFADKLAVRDYVRSCGFEAILPKLYGVFESKETLVDWLSNLKDKKKNRKADANVDKDKDKDKDVDIGATVDADIENDCAEIDLNGFVLKCNHGSGPSYYSICRDVEAFDIEKEAEKLGNALKQDYSYMALEYHYHYIKPYIYAEELLGENCTDYKFFCFSGKPMYVKVIADRMDTNRAGKQVKHQDYYDMDWNFCPFVKEENSMGGGLERPEGFEEMKKMAAKLSEPFPMARVDLYYEKGKVYFGEITLTPAYGMNRTDKQETLQMFGNLTDLSYWKPELLDFPRTDEIERLKRESKT